MVPVSRFRPFFFRAGTNPGQAARITAVLSGQGRCSRLADFRRFWWHSGMKHTGQAALDRLEPLLGQLRRLPALKEKARGTFYRGGRAFLHFHEHGDELFADLRVGEDFERFAVTRAADRAGLMQRIAAALSASSR